MPRTLKRVMTGALVLAAIACTRDNGGAVSGERPVVTRYGMGRTATSAEIAVLDIDVAPDGHGLPPGRGTVAQGATLFAQKCANCHAAQGQGMPPVFPALVGRDPKGEGFPFANDWRITRTIGNYWPEATTIFDYVRRAMPHSAPGSLTNDEVYALTAFLLAANQVIAVDATLDSAALLRVKMPYHNKFVRDNRRGGHEVK